MKLKVFLIAMAVLAIPLISGASIQDVVRSTGQVFTFKNGGWVGSTAWLFHNDGERAFFVGAGHAISEADQKRVKLRFYYPDTTDYIECKVEYFIYDTADYTKDLCILSISSNDLPKFAKPLEIGRNPYVGDNVIVFGCNRGDPPSMFFGRILDSTNRGLYKNSTNTNSGCSGAAVYDISSNKVVGVHVRSGSHFIPIEIVRSRLLALP